MSKQAKHTPTPWSWKVVTGAGIEIFAPVHLCESVRLPDGMPKSPINVFGMTAPQNTLISAERWVQFEPSGWDEMQRANAEFIVRSVNSVAALAESCRELKEVVQSWVDHFDDLDRKTEADDPLRDARRLYHGDRIEKSRVVLKNAESALAGNGGGGR